MTLFSVAFEGDRPLQDYPKLAKEAESLGFRSFQIYDHLPFKPAWPIAFLTGQQTRRILIGPVTVPVFLYHPLTLARNLGALSEITNGRAILGISRGAYAKYLGESVDRSIRHLLETVDSIAKLIRSLHVRIKPELYVGTSGPTLAFKASSLTAVKGIVVDNLWNPEYARRLRGILDEAQRKSNRREKVLLIARPFTMLSETKEKAIRNLNPILTSYLPHLVGDSPMLATAGISYHRLLKVTKEGDRIPPRVIENLAAAGNPNDILDQVELMLKAGVDHVCFGHPLGPEPAAVMRTLARKVSSHFD